MNNFNSSQPQQHLCFKGCKVRMVVGFRRVCLCKPVWEQLHKPCPLREALLHRDVLIFKQDVLNQPLLILDISTAGLFNIGGLGGQGEGKSLGMQTPAVTPAIRCDWPLPLGLD